MQIKNLTGNSLESQYEYKVINTISELFEFVNDFSIDDFAFDTETTDVSYDRLSIVCLSLYSKELDYAYVIPFNFSAEYTVKVRDPENKRRKKEVSRTFTRTDCIDIEEAKPLLNKMFSGKSVIGANIKFDLKVAYKYGFYSFNIQDDVNMMSFYIDANERKGLKPNAFKYLGIKMESYADTVGQKIDNINWSEVDWDKYYRYSGFDSYVTYYLREKVTDRLKTVGKVRHKSIKDVDSYRAYREVGLSIIPPTAFMEINGVYIDVPYLNELSVKAHKEINVLERKIFDIAGYEFNIGSAKQLGEILFDVLGYKSVLKTASGARSVNETVLKMLNYEGYEIAGLILEYRKLLKLTSTYIDAIPKMVGSDGRLRGSFNETGTRTSRFSSSNPNLQNQPNNKKFPVRKAFTAKKGKILIVGDYSQIEMRLLAHFSNDKNLIDAYLNNEDMHRFTADKISFETGLHLTRPEGKTMNFAISYLMGADSLANKLNESLRDLVISGELDNDEYLRKKVTKKRAKKMIDAYFTVFSGFNSLVERVVKYAMLTGFISTVGGFCRPIPEIRDKRTFGYGKRRAVNTKIQGSAAYIIMLTMIKVFEYIQHNPDLMMLMQVHDELIFECDENKAQKHLKAIKEIAEGVFPQCKVPIPFDIGIYKHWSDAKAGNSYKIEDIVELIELKIY